MYITITVLHAAVIVVQLQGGARGAEEAAHGAGVTFSL